MEEQIINTLKLVKNSQLKDINDIELKLLFPFNGLLNNLSSILDNPVKISDLSIEELKKVLPDFDINIINKLEMYKKLSMLSYFPLTMEQKDEIVDITNRIINDLNNKKEFLIDNNEDIKDKKNIIEIIGSLIDKINNLYNGKNYLTSFDIDNIALYLKLSDLSIDKQMAIIQDISLKSLELINNIKVNKEDEEVTLLEETNLSESDVFDLFDKYNYNFDDFKDKDKVQLLRYGNLSTINDILKVFSDNDVSLYIKGFSSKLVQILLHSNGNIVSSIMSNLKDDCTENKYIVNSGKRAYYKSRSGGKKKIVDDLSLDDKRYVTGAYDNYIKNRKLFISRGIDPTNIIKDCPSVFCLSYNKVKENFDSFDFYKIPPEIYNNTLSSLQAVDPLSSIDQFIEVGCYEYILSNFSYVNKRSDDLMFYRIVKASQMNKDIYSKRRTQKVQFISSISNDKNNEFNLNDSNKVESVGQYIPTFDSRFDDVVNSNRNAGPIILAYNNYFIKKVEEYKMDDLRYNFNGVIISRYKVLRIYETLIKNHMAGTLGAIKYAICKNSILTEEQYRNIEDCLEKVYGKNLRGVARR